MVSPMTFCCSFYSKPGEVHVSALFKSVGNIFFDSAETGSFDLMRVVSSPSDIEPQKGIFSSPENAIFDGQFKVQIQSVFVY
jgi:hypothetical protein